MIEALEGALCAEPEVDPELFFDTKREAEAVAMCQMCPTSGQCLVDVMKRENYGVWAGTTERQRGHFTWKWERS